MLRYNTLVKRNKPLAIMILPVIACVIIVGWIMYVTGQNATTKKPTEAAQQCRKSCS